MIKNFNFLKILRIDHWIKNLIIFLPLIFSNNFLEISNFLIALKLFCHFSLLSSAIYIFNDILDYKSDKKHPIKKFRVLPLKILSIQQAILLHILLLVLSIFFISQEILFISFTYLVINYLYSLYLKKIFILDIICVSSGYYLRVLAISILANINLSLYFIVMIFLIAFFILTSKRYLGIKFSNKTNFNNLNFSYFKYYKVSTNIFLILIFFIYSKYILENVLINYLWEIILIFISQFILLLVLYMFYKTIIVLKRDENPVSIFLNNRQIYFPSVLWLIYNIFLYIYVL